MTPEEQDLNFLATGDNVILEIIIPEKTKGGIVLPQVQDGKEHFKRMGEMKPLRVVSLGTRAIEQLKDDEIKAGDYVYVSAGIQADLMKLKGKSFFRVNAYDIIGKAPIPPTSDENKAQLSIGFSAAN